MLKDEASLSREKMSKINVLEKFISSVAEDFKQDLKKSKIKKLILKLNKKLIQNMVILSWGLRIDWNK